MDALRNSIAALLLLALAAGTASATVQQFSTDAAGRIVLSAAGMSLDQAVKMVEQRFRARVVRAEAHQENGRTVYVLRLLNDSGRVWTVRVDADNGAVM